MPRSHRMTPQWVASTKQIEKLNHLRPEMMGATLLAFHLVFSGGAVPLSPLCEERRPRSPSGMECVAQTGTTRCFSEACSLMLDAGMLTSAGGAIANNDRLVSLAALVASIATCAGGFCVRPPLSASLRGCPVRLGREGVGARSSNRPNDTARPRRMSTTEACFSTSPISCRPTRTSSSRLAVSVDTLVRGFPRPRTPQALPRSIGHCWELKVLP